jgi:iron complex transport system substrate-binding protein
MRPRLVLAAITVLTATPACGPERTSVGDTQVTRVLSLTPSVTDLMIALGERDRLVGRTRYDTTGLDDLPSVGGSLDPSLEVVAGLRPDLVIAGLEVLEDRVAAIQRLGIRVERVRAETLGDVGATLALLGKLLAIAPRADSLWQAIVDTIAAVRADYPDRERVRVFFAVCLFPPMSVGPGAFVDDLIEIAGGENIFSDAGARWPTVSIEAVVERDPQIVILPMEIAGPDPLDRLGQLAGWQLIPAVRKGDVVAVNSDIFSRPGPRVGEAARHLAVILHKDTSETPNGSL